ncbi:MAG: hypothetical protein V4494_03255 [Chlamydiota bacterium]
MLKENIDDAAEILQNILTQPLDIPGASANISLLAAAQNPDKTDLRKILEAFRRYPELTQSLLTELDLLSQDLKVK